MFDINFAGVCLWFSGLGMGYVLSILCKLDEIEKEDLGEPLDYDRDGKAIRYENVDSNHV